MSKRIGRWRTSSPVSPRSVRRTEDQTCLDVIMIQTFPKDPGVSTLIGTPKKGFVWLSSNKIHLLVLLYTFIAGPPTPCDLEASTCCDLRSGARIILITCRSHPRVVKKRTLTAHSSDGPNHWVNLTRDLCRTATVPPKNEVCGDVF